MQIEIDRICPVAAYVMGKAVATVGTMHIYISFLEPGFLKASSHNSTKGSSESSVKR